MDKIKETFGIREKFSLENARYLCAEVERIEENALSEETGPQAAKALEASLQTIRTLTEVLVWMDRNKEEWFERVMERDVVNTLERLVTNGLMPSAVKLQSLQSVTVLLQNLSRNSSIYYICSNNHINRMVAVEFDMHDDEFVSLYVSFLKTLALRCTPDTVQFFFDLQDNAFPLWDRAVRLLGSEDAMVRTAAKQIVITLAQLQDSAVATFVERAIVDVFFSVMRSVDDHLTRLAADIPSYASLLRMTRPAVGAAGVGAAGAGAASAAFAFWPSPPPASLTPSPSPPRVQPERKLPAVKKASVVMHLEDIEDELLYLNDVCRAPVANVGSQAAAAAQRLFLSRFQRIVVQETRAAATAVDDAAAGSAPAPSGGGGGGWHDAFNASSTPDSPLLQSTASDIPASVALAFLLYWLQVNTDLQVCAALMGFLVQPIEGLTPPPPGALNSGSVSNSIAVLVLESSRVDLHEVVAAVFEHALRQSALAPSPSHVEAFRSGDAAPLLRFPASLSQFFYAETPYQHTGLVLVGGPNSTLPPPKEKFVQRAWVGETTVKAGASPRATPAPQQVLAVLTPHLLAALYTQLRYFHVTRLSCFASTLSLLVRLLPVDARGDKNAACARVWEAAYVEVMKLTQRAVLECVNQYASVIQKAVRAQQDADGEVPLSRISFRDIEDSTDSEEAPLPIRDPYAAMFLKLREAAQWLDADTPDRRALLAAAHTRHDVYLFFPAFPSVDEERRSLVLHLWPPLKAVHYYAPPSPQREALVEAFRSVQTGVKNAFALSQRSPVSATESELNLYVMFLLAKHTFESRAFSSYSNNATVDVLRQTLRQLCPQLRPPQLFTLSPATATLSARCELASAWYENAADAGFAALGTPLCLVLPSAPTGESGRELLLLDANGGAPDYPHNHRQPSQQLHVGECKRRVLLSLDLSFVGVSLHPRYPFKLIISYQLEERRRLLSVVLCDVGTAKTVVFAVAKAANECRARGASFSFGIMNYRSALLD